MTEQPLHILLADDDPDDIRFFADALSGIPLETSLKVVRDGEELMAYLFENIDRLPDVLFLDLSMPRKTGYECLVEIGANEKLKRLSVVMYSTAFPRDTLYEHDLMNTLMRLGAEDHIRKPTDFTKIKEAIHQALVRLNIRKASSLTKKKL